MHPSDYCVPSSKDLQIIRKVFSPIESKRLHFINKFELQEMRVLSTNDCLVFICFRSRWQLVTNVFGTRFRIFIVFIEFAELRRRRN